MKRSPPTTPAPGRAATKAELEALILHKVRRNPKLACIEMIAVDGKDRDRGSWHVIAYPSAAARLGELNRIVLALQKTYVLKAH